MSSRRPLVSHAMVVLESRFKNFGNGLGVFWGDLLGLKASEAFRALGTRFGICDGVDGAPKTTLESCVRFFIAAFSDTSHRDFLGGQLTRVES